MSQEDLLPVDLDSREVAFIRGSTGLAPETKQSLYRL